MMFRWLAILVVAATLTACGSIQLTVGAGREASISHPDLKKCPGVRFKITVQQAGKTVSVENVAAAGRIKFRSSDLKDIDFAKPVTVTITVVEVPTNPGTANCPFTAGQTKMGGPLVLVPLASDEYAIDFDKLE